MLGYLIGESQYYPPIFILCFFLTNESLKNFCVAILGLMLIDQSYNSFVLDYYSGWFFHIKAVLDICWLLLAMSMIKIKTARNNIIKVCLVSFSVNVFLCIDTSSNIIYEYWNEINFLLFEVVIYLILKESPYLKKINSWLCGATSK